MINNKKIDKKRIILLLLGPLSYILSRMFLQDLFGFEGASALGVSFWMVLWWVTGPVGVGVAAMVPVAVNAIFEFTAMGDIIAQYSSATVILLFGAGLLTQPWTKIGLDRRVALFGLRIVGPSIKGQMVAWFTVSLLLSTVLPNFATIVLLCPVAAAMLHELDDRDLAHSDLTTPILSPIVMGSCVGGGITPLGGAMNIIAMDAVSAHSGVEFLFMDWVIRMAPFVLILGIVHATITAITPTKRKKIEGTKEYFKQKYDELGVFSRDEKIYLFLFILAGALCFLRPLYTEILPGLIPSYVLLIFGMLGFVLTDQKGETFLTFENAAKNTSWNVLFIVAGASILGVILQATGTITVLSQMISSVKISNDFLLMLMFVTLSSTLTLFASATTTSGVMVPLVITVTSALGQNPIPYVFAVCLGFSNPQVGPVSVGVIMGYGAKLSDIIKRNWPLLIVHVILTTVLCWLAMNYVPYFSNLPGFTG